MHGSFLFRVFLLDCRALMLSNNSILSLYLPFEVFNFSLTHVSNLSCLHFNLCDQYAGEDQQREAVNGIECLHLVLILEFYH